MVKGLTFLSWSFPGGKGQKRVHPGAVMLGLVTAVGVTVAAVIFTGVYVMVSTSPVYHLPVLITAATIGSAVLGGLVAGAVSSKQGLVHGGLVGVTYGLIYIGLFVYAGIMTLETALLSKLLLMLTLGGFGGVVGVNMPGTKKKRRSITIRMSG